jgi:hypothetical protein
MISYKRNSKILFLIGFICVAHISIAQTRFALFAGANATTSSYSVRGAKQTTDIKPGFILGASYKIEFEKNLYFSPAAFYSLKGYKVTLNQAAYPPGTEVIKNNVTVHSIEIAPLLQYDFSSRPTHFFIKLGPCFEMQLYGKEKMLLISGATVSSRMKYGFAEYGRYSASALLQFGYQLNRNVFVQAYYAHGLSNLNNADHGPDIKYRSGGLSVGRFF